MVMNVGPFQFYRVESNGTLDISLRCLGDAACGWEYGWHDDMRGTDHSWVDFRIGKLRILYFKPFNFGFEFWLLGFWMIPSWGKLWWER